MNRLHSTLILVALAVALAGLCACSRQPPREQNPSPKQIARPGPQVVLPRARVDQFDVQPPRSLVLSDMEKNSSQVWFFDETRQGEGFLNQTEVYSRAGCALAGAPLQAGDVVKVVGHRAPDQRLVADIIWVLTIEMDAADCTGPPADQEGR